MRAFHFLTIALLSLGVSACVNTQEPANHNNASPLDEYTKYCREAGFEPNSTKEKQCAFELAAVNNPYFAEMLMRGTAIRAATQTLVPQSSSQTTNRQIKDFSYNELQSYVNSVIIKCREMGMPAGSQEEINCRFNLVAQADPEFRKDIETGKINIPQFRVTRTQ